MTVQVTSLKNFPQTLTSVPGAPFVLGPFKTARFEINTIPAELLNLDNLRFIQAELDISTPDLTPAQLAALATQAESVGVDWGNTAAVNTTRMNAALARRGLVTLTRPGQYMFGGPGIGSLLIPSNTTLICAEGVELICANQTHQPLIRNTNSFDPGTAATGSIAYSGGGWGLRGTVTATGIQLKHPVGSWIGVLNLDLSNQANRSYQGVYQVTAVGTNTITYEMVDTPPSGGNSTSGAIIYPADTNIRIIGGMWDGNDVGQTGSPYNDGDPNHWVQTLRNTQNTIVQGCSYRRGLSWTVGSNNIRDATYRDLYADLYTDGLGTANAIFQGTGGARNVLIDGVSGTSDDNLVAWSLDAVGSWTYQNHWNGDVYNLRIKNVNSSANNAAIIKLWGNTNARYHSVLIDGVTGRANTEGAVGVDCGFTQTSMLNTRGGKLTIKNVAVACPGAPVTVRSDGDWDHIEIDQVQQKRAGSAAAPLVQILKRSGGTVQTIRRLDIKNLSWSNPGSVLNRTTCIVEISDTNIFDLNISGIPQARINAVTGLVNFIGVEGVVDRAVVTGLNGIANATGDMTLVRCANTVAGALGQLTLRDSTFTAFDASGGLALQTAAGKVTKVRLDNNTFTNARAGHVSGVLRDGTGMTVDTINITTA